MRYVVKVVKSNSREIACKAMTFHIFITYFMGNFQKAFLNEILNKRMIAQIKSFVHPENVFLKSLFPYIELTLY